jgi:predicted nuclease with TOPRIM domain
MSAKEESQSFLETLNKVKALNEQFRLLTEERDELRSRLDEIEAQDRRKEDILRIVCNLVANPNWSVEGGPTAERARVVVLMASSIVDRIEDDSTTSG